MEPDYDVAVIGAGDVGTAIARELSRFALRIALIDAGDDVGAGTSKANTAILHTGFDAKPATLEARLVARGHTLLSAYAAEVGIPYERTGALMIAWSDEQLARLPQVRENAQQNGYEHVRELAVEELHRREPHLGAGALGALEIPGEGIVCPWTTPLACATQAVLAGAQLRLQERVGAVGRREDGSWQLSSTRGGLSARWLINAAGLFSDQVHAAAGFGGFTVTPRRGELIVFDKLARPLISHVLLPVPSAGTKGVLVAPTVFGNVLLGPTAVDIEDRADTSTTAAGIAGLRELGRSIMPELLECEVTATYAGLRAATEHADYQLIVDADRRYACAGGIRSTGLTSGLAIAEYLREQLADAGLALRERDGPLPAVTMPNIGEASLRPYADPGRIAADAEYGRVVCFCERVSGGEIRDAARSEIPPCDLGGVRRRTRATMGRCQGFFCEAQITRLLELHRDDIPGGAHGRRR